MTEYGIAVIDAAYQFWDSAFETICGVNFESFRGAYRRSEIIVCALFCGGSAYLSDAICM